MATSAITFQGPVTLNSDFTTGTASFTFRPPSNLSGKDCYLEARAFALTWDETYATPQPHHSFLLRSSWNQIQAGAIEPISATNTEFTQRFNPPLAMLTYQSMQSASIPTLVSIPHGPHSVTFTISRLDNGVIGIATTDIVMCVMITMVSANSRQPPIV